MRINLLRVVAIVLLLLALFPLREVISYIPEYPDQQAVPIATLIANTQFNDPKDRISAEISLRQYQTDNDVKIWSMLLQVVGAVALAVGALVTWRNFIVSRETLNVAESRLGVDKETLLATEKRLEIDRQSQLSTRYTQATLHLGAQLQNGGGPNLELRLGAIDELEQLAVDSPAHRDRVLIRLSTYVRENALRTPPVATGSDTTVAPSTWDTDECHRHWNDPIATRHWIPRADIQSALNVLGRMGPSPDKSGVTFNLSGASLRGAILAEGHFERANLSHADLDEAFLKDVHLEKAQLIHTSLNGAILEGAHLEEANLRDAHLDCAFCERANFDAAVLIDTSLTRLWNKNGPERQGVFRFW